MNRQYEILAQVTGFPLSGLMNNNSYPSPEKIVEAMDIWAKEFALYSLMDVDLDSEEEEIWEERVEKLYELFKNK